MRGCVNAWMNSGGAGVRNELAGLKVCDRGGVISECKSLYLVVGIDVSRLYFWVKYAQKC